MVVGQNLGPLTTAATLRSTCADDLNQIYRINTLESWYYLLQGPPEGASCYPSAYAGVRSQYYSPAASCPFGFTPACTSTNGESETVYTCCPTQFDYICQSTSIYQWETTLGCMVPVNSDLTTTWKLLDVQNGKTVTSTSTGYQGGMNAFSVQVRFQSSDLIAGKTSTTAPERTPSHGSDQASNTETANTSNGLTAGAAAGIAVGATALLLAVAVAIFIMFRRRKRHQQVQQPAAAQFTDSYYPSPAPKYTSAMDVSAPKIYEAPNIMYELEGAAPGTAR
ncbi:hypothetical protein PG985_004351 [Apiospora marii]|uniref:uncharacterized protein n=1 Tax=Apiospora marii TaxID=335849 RepID=UPI0031313EE2